jgi:hypothetical protein
MSLSGWKMNELENAGWKFGFKLTTEHIWDTFVVFSLIEDCLSRNVVLEVPHGGKQKQKDSFKEAMHKWNE